MAGESPSTVATARSTRDCWTPAATASTGEKLAFLPKGTLLSLAPPAQSRPQAVSTPALRVPGREVISASPAMGEQSTLQEQSTVIQSRVMGGRSPFLL